MNAPLSAAALQQALPPEPTGDGLPDIAAWPLGRLLETAQSLISQGHQLAAAGLYERWLSGSQPAGRAVAAFNHGALLQQLGHADHALKAYETALQADPAMGAAWINLGLIHERAGRHDHALSAWSRCAGTRHLRAQADTDLQCTALNHIGRLHETLRRYDLAESALRESLQINPDQAGVIQHWVHVRQKACLWPVYGVIAGVSPSRMLRCTSPLAMLALTEDPLRQLATAQSFVQRTYAFPPERLCDAYPRRDRRLRRIGLLSADFREHAVGFLLPRFLSGFDTERVELYAYDSTRPEETAQRLEILAHFNVVRPIQDLGDQQAAELIAKDELDILLDLHGLSSGARPGILARRPARRQGTYLGFVGTTALPWLDFVLVDEQVLPPESALMFTERPVYLDAPFIPLSRRTTTPSAGQGTCTRQEVGLSADSFVMAAFGNVYKITPELFGVWCGLLQRIPGTVLWLLDDNPATSRNLRAEAGKRGIGADRLVFASRVDHETFRRRLSLADVYLDTYPYNGGSTTNDVIDAGVPLVSRYGPTMVSRMGLSILSAVGQPDMAVDSFEAYADKVVEVWLRRGWKAPWRAASDTPVRHQAWIERVMADQPEPAVVAAVASSRHRAGPLMEITWDRHATVVEIEHHARQSLLRRDAQPRWSGGFTAEELIASGLRPEQIEQAIQETPPDIDLIACGAADPLAWSWGPFDAPDRDTARAQAEWQALRTVWPDLPSYPQAWCATAGNSLPPGPWLATRRAWLLWLEALAVLRLRAPKAAILNEPRRLMNLVAHRHGLKVHGLRGFSQEGAATAHALKLAWLATGQSVYRESFEAACRAADSHGV